LPEFAGFDGFSCSF